MYKLTRDNKSVIRKLDGACIPVCEGNVDYQGFKQWKLEGGVPEEAEGVEEVRSEVLGKLRKEKLDVRSEGILVDDILFDTDVEARLAYLELMFKFMMNPEYVVENWKASEGVWVIMNKSMFDKLVLAWEGRLTSLFSFVREKEAEIKSKDDLEEIKITDVTYSKH